jgi:hypothetical protein
MLFEQQELAQARVEAGKEAACHQAAKRAAADAREDLHRLEFRYQMTIEQLERQVRHMQWSKWKEEMKKPSVIAGRRGGERPLLRNLSRTMGVGYGEGDRIQYPPDGEFTPSLDEDIVSYYNAEEQSLKGAPPPPGISDHGLQFMQVEDSSQVKEVRDSSDDLHTVRRIQQAASAEQENVQSFDDSLSMPHYQLLLQMRSNLFAD